MLVVMMAEETRRGVREGATPNESGSRRDVPGPSSANIEGWHDPSITTMTDERA